MGTRDFARLHSPRQGVTVVEVLISFVLLSGLLAISTSLLVKHGRLLRAQRDYRIALDELTNQMDRLTSLSDSELVEAVDHLAPSSFAASHLPGAQLQGDIQPADVGQRVVLRIWWDEPQRRAAPVRLAAWIVPGPDDRAVSLEGDIEP